MVQCACDPGAEGSGGETVVDHIRLFPLLPDVRWTYRVHEQILPALRKADIPVRWTDLIVRHTGYADVALRARKLERDSRILLEELKDRPDEAFILFNLGAIAIERQRVGEAPRYLRRSLQRSASSDSITRKLFALIARAHQMLGDTERGAAGPRRGSVAGPRGRGAVVPQSGRVPAAGRVGRRGALLADDPGPVAAGAVRQRGHGSLRASDPAQPGSAGRRARGPRGRGAALAGRARGVSGRRRGAGEAGTIRGRLGADRPAMTLPRFARGRDAMPGRAALADAEETAAVQPSAGICSGLEEKAGCPRELHPIGITNFQKKPAPFAFLRRSVTLYNG